MIETVPDKPWLIATAESPDWRTRMEFKNQVFYADEPVAAGGADSAPAPGDLLLSALASCTLITIQMYARRKEIDVAGMSVAVRYFSETIGGARKTRFEKKIMFPPNLDEMVKARLLQVSEACPISKILNGEISTQTAEETVA